MIVGSIVREAVAKRFPSGDAQLVVRRFAETDLPFLDDPRKERERNRVHLAVVKLADGQVIKFESALEQAALGWRDVLLAAGLGHEDWPEVLRTAGFPVP
jgi:hypothetical protein